MLVWKATPSMTAMMSTILRDDALIEPMVYVERHRDYFAASTTDIGHKLGAAYSVGGTRLRAAFERLRYEPAPGRYLSRNAWQLAATRNRGPHIWRA